MIDILLSRAAPLALALTVVACTMTPAAQSSVPAVARASPIAVRTTAVALNPDDAAQDRVGRFVYAGGLELVTPASVRLGGLSDLSVLPGGRVLSVTDEGQFFEARLVLDPAGRLTGLEDVSLTPLAGLDGHPLLDKSAADAEGVTLLPSGDRLVSFERQHRVWRYPAGGAPPVAAPMPASAPELPINTGLEALAVIPAVAPDAYLVGSEEGVVWLCTLSGSCRETMLGRHVPEGYNLPAIAVSPDGGVLAIVGRAFDTVRGVRVVVRLVPREAIERPDAAMLDELPLLAPLARDNFEGAALVARPGGGLRLYLISDNNYSTEQRSYLFAFDWTPGGD